MIYFYTFFEVYYLFKSLFQWNNIIFYSLNLSMPSLNFVRLFCAINRFIAFSIVTPSIVTTLYQLYIEKLGLLNWLQSRNLIHWTSLHRQHWTGSWTVTRAKPGSPIWFIIKDSSVFLLVFFLHVLVSDPTVIAAHCTININQYYICNPVIINI